MYRPTKKEYRQEKTKPTCRQVPSAARISVGLRRVEPSLGIRAQLDVRIRAPTSATQPWDAMVTVYQSAGKRARRAKMGRQRRDLPANCWLMKYFFHQPPKRQRHRKAAQFLRQAQRQSSATAARCHKLSAFPRALAHSGRLRRALGGGARYAVSL